MKIFSILFFLFFFIALGFSSNPDKKWILGDRYFNAGDSWPTIQNSDGNGISRSWALSDGNVSSVVFYDQGLYPGVWADCHWDVGFYTYHSSASQYNMDHVPNPGLQLNPDYGNYPKPVWVGIPQTGQTILQGQTKYIDISSFSPACTDYSFSSSGGQVSRVGSALSVSASASTTAISGSFKGLKEGFWSDDVPFSFTVLKSLLAPIQIIQKNEPGQQVSDLFESDIGASNYIITDKATNGQNFNKSSTGGTLDTSSLSANQVLIAKAFDSSGNLIMEKQVVFQYDDPVSKISSPVTSSTFLPNQIAITSPSFIVSKSGEPVYQAVTNAQVGGVIYSLDPNNPSSKYLSINSKTGVVTGAPPSGTGEYQFDVIASGYAISPVNGQIDMEKALTNKKTIYATQQDIANPVSSAVIAANNIQAEQANSSQSIINNQYSQTQVFNDMSQLLTQISNNTNPDIAVPMDTTDIVDAINRTNELLGGLVPDGSMDAEVDKDALAVSPNISVSSVTSALNHSYDNSAPVLTIPLHLCNVGGLSTFEDYEVIFGEGGINIFIQALRMFFLGCVALYFSIQTIKLFRSFES